MEAFAGELKAKPLGNDSTKALHTAPPTKRTSRVDPHGLDAGSSQAAHGQPPAKTGVRLPFLDSLAVICSGLPCGSGCACTFSGHPVPSDAAAGKAADNASAATTPHAEHILPESAPNSRREAIAALRRGSNPQKPPPNGKEEDRATRQAVGSQSSTANGWMLSLNRPSLTGVFLGPHVLMRGCAGGRGRAAP